MVLSFYHTCASRQHHDLHDRESPMLSLSYTKWEFFIIELGLYIPMMGFLKMPQVFMSKQVGCTPTQFLFYELSYTYSSSASVAWQSLLLALTSIDGHLHSPLISRINVRLSPFFCLLQTTPIIIFYSIHSAMSMAHAHVLRES